MVKKLTCYTQQINFGQKLKFHFLDSKRRNMSRLGNHFLVKNLKDHIFRRKMVKNLTYYTQKIEFWSKIESLIFGLKKTDSKRRNIPSLGNQFLT